ncbi:RNA polymerase sigma factor [Clostridium polynesiense]|uniref:RNA polymerase sigma factor n=1 Tax=Clostridium polynesiense TaxID=1325933 RepID=UPI000ADF821C|nr:RNA polymerase sigma factor [Clostridium polynesiense]
MKNIEILYMEYKKDIYYYLLNLTHNQSLSEDLLQETFIKAISSINNFKGQSSVKTWLLGIARNLWLQSLRSEKSNLEYNDLLEIYVRDCVDDNLITEEISVKIEELIRLKEKRTQEIVKLRIQGVSYNEISLKLAISESSARVIDFRTKKWIKNKLEEEGYL